MTQLAYMIVISLLAAIIAGSLVWLGWELVAKLLGRKGKLQTDADALLKQAKEPSEKERPK